MHHTTMLADPGPQPREHHRPGPGHSRSIASSVSAWATVREIHTSGYGITAVAESANDQRVAVRRSVSQPKTTRGRTR